MSGLSSDLYNQCRDTLLRCGPFDSDRALRTVFVDTRLNQWRNDLPQASSPNERVSFVIEFLCGKYDKHKKNALILLLIVLIDRDDPQDACHQELTELVEILEPALRTIEPKPMSESNVSQNSDVSVTGSEQQVKVSLQNMNSSKPRKPEVARVYKVLVVDDVQDSLSTIGGILGDAGHGVRLCVNSEEALRAIKEERFDIAVIDLHLHGDDVDDDSGLTLTWAIKRLDEDIRIIIMTGYRVYAQHVVRAIQDYGAVNFMEKGPSLNEELIKAINKAYEQPRAFLSTRTIGHREYKLAGVNWEIFSFLASQGVLREAFKAVDEYENRLFVVLGGREYDERLGTAKQLLVDQWNAEVSLFPYPFVEILSEFEFDRRFHKGYRDHITHQLRVYLLGLYLYYGVPGVRRAVDEEFRKSENPEDEFLHSWKVASFFHDLGYVFEVERDNKQTAYSRILQELNNLFEYPLFAYCGVHSIPLLKSEEYSLQEQAKIPRHRVDSFRDIELWGRQSILEHVEPLAVPAHLSHRFGGLGKYYRYALGNSPLDVSRSSFVDHGIASALILLHLYRFFEEYMACVSESLQEGKVDAGLLSKRTSNALVELAALVKGVKESISHAAAAIALHNIQPDIWDYDDARKAEGLTLNEFNLSLQGTPLAFLLALVDALQDWDRPMFSAPTQASGYVSQDQDISISFVDDRIQVRFLDDELAGTSQSKFQKFMDGLRKNLNNCDVDALLVEGVG